MRSLQRLSSRPASRILQAESSTRKALEQSRIRLLCVAAFFAFSFIALAARLIEVSVVGGGDLPFKRLVENPQLLLQREDDVDVSSIAAPEDALRRDIVDRHGQVLATSIETASLVANPTIIRHEETVAAGLAKIFPEMAQQDILRKLNRKRSTFVYIKRHLTPVQQHAVNNLGVPGLFFERDMRRVYPYGGLFAHTVGYVDVDNRGIAGIEKALNQKLEEPWHSDPLTLSLDARVQSVLASELAATVKKFSAIGATGIIADIRTGEMIAMVNLPSFDPHFPARASEEQKFHRASLGTYEMGSTFKTFTAAAALEAGVTSMDGGYDASSPIRVARFTINDTHPLYRYMSVPEIFAYSSNIGTVKMAMDLGTERQKSFLKKIGILEPVQIELPERGHPLYPKEWRDINTMTISYGHGISVTPLNIVKAFAALVDHGRLKKLTLLKADAPALIGAPVISEKTSQEVNDLLRLTVVKGTAKGANAPGYMVGGKTGTAEKVVTGGYKEDAKIASFMGAFPMDNPRYAILIMVDEPKGIKETYGYATGGWVSAPVVGKVVQRVGPMLGLKPTSHASEAALEEMWKQSEAHAVNVQLSRTQKPKTGGVHEAAF